MICDGILGTVVGVLNAIAANLTQTCELWSLRSPKHVTFTVTCTFHFWFTWLVERRWCSSTPERRAVYSGHHNCSPYLVHYVVSVHLLARRNELIHPRAIKICHLSLPFVVSKCSECQSLPEQKYVSVQKLEDITLWPKDVTGCDQRPEYLFYHNFCIIRGVLNFIVYVYVNTWIWVNSDIVVS